MQNHKNFEDQAWDSMQHMLDNNMPVDTKSRYRIPLLICFFFLCGLLTKNILQNEYIDASYVQNEENTLLQKALPNSNPFARKTYTAGFFTSSKKESEHTSYIGKNSNTNSIVEQNSSVTLITEPSQTQLSTLHTENSTPHSAIPVMCAALKSIIPSGTMESQSRIPLPPLNLVSTSSILKKQIEAPRFNIGTEITYDFHTKKQKAMLKAGYDFPTKKFNVHLNVATGVKIRNIQSGEGSTIDPLSGVLAERKDNSNKINFDWVNGCDFTMGYEVLNGVSAGVGGSVRAVTLLNRRPQLEDANALAFVSCQVMHHLDLQVSAQTNMLKSKNPLDFHTLGIGVQYTF